MFEQSIFKEVDFASLAAFLRLILSFQHRKIISLYKNITNTLVRVFRRHSKDQTNPLLQTELRRKERSPQAKVREGWGGGQILTGVGRVVTLKRPRSGSNPT